ncbi:MAG: Alpha/beta hydrolase fold-3 domain protein [Nocardioides sp.]|jgi:monoterpene epsilon-lactone hydrolase|nr:Alpha/beta hydrolase fold-3 domain protein [Nocardioides sp.]
MRWDVDDRPATAYTRAYIAAMWLNRDKQAFEGARRTLATARKKQRAGDRAPTLLTRLATRVTSSAADGFTVWTARPRRRPPVARVIYLHGGGYVHPLTADYWRLVRALVAAPAEVIVPAYPLAPAATVDDVLPRLVDLVADAIRRDPGRATILMGDSAGGALALVVAQELRDPSQPPAAVVALCPWLDATLGDEAVRDLEAADPMLAETGLRAAGRWWARPRSPEDRRVSPLNGDLRGLPPLEVYVGDRDILRPGVDALARLADREGADLRVREVPAMFHVWMTRAIPEGRRTRLELAELVRSYAGS